MRIQLFFLSLGMEEKLQKLLELAQKEVEKAIEKQSYFEPDYEDGKPGAADRYHFWEGVEVCADMFVERIKTLM